MVTVQSVDIDRAKAWIDEHWTGSNACPICENVDWTMGDVVGEVRQLPRNRRLIGAPVYPLVFVTCTTCGYTLLFNAIVVGLVEVET